jgi:hypothetical protein
MLRLYDNRKSLIQILLGAFWTTASVVVLILAIIVFAQHGREATQRRHEAATVKLACQRSKAFGPPLILHIERVEGRLHTGALEAGVEWPPNSGRKVGVLAFYRQTIPKHCPH